MVDNYHINDFTEENYKKLLCLAKEKFYFKHYHEIVTEKHAILRHDVDHSIYQAFKLSQIEKSIGVTATYFIFLHSEMYNTFEKATLDLIKKIIENGHKIGLHFDVSFYNKLVNKDELKLMIKFEKNILEQLLNIEVEYISFHSPDFDNTIIDLRQEKICEMFNTYSSSIFEQYEYISDSNGHWRFERLEDVLRKTENNLHILTHPVWWSEKPMLPRHRIQHCIVERAKYMGDSYDKFTKSSNRLNIGLE